MKLTRQLAINQSAISARRCPSCHAAAGERCFQIRLGVRVVWDQAVHKLRLR